MLVWGLCHSVLLLWTFIGFCSSSCWKTSTQTSENGGIIKIWWNGFSFQEPEYKKLRARIYYYSRSVIIRTPETQSYAPHANLESFLSRVACKASDISDIYNHGDTHKVTEWLRKSYQYKKWRFQFNKLMLLWWWAVDLFFTYLCYDLSFNTDLTPTHWRPCICIPWEKNNYPN